MCLGKCIDIDFHGNLPQTPFHTQLAIFSMISNTSDRFEQKITANPYNYKLWLDYITFIDDNVAENNFDFARSIYMIAASYIPPNDDLNTLTSYVDLLMSHADYEEYVAKDIEGARQVYDTNMKRFPHTTIVYERISLSYGIFEQRNENYTAARAVFEMAISASPHEAIFQQYIGMENELSEFDNCRRLYNQYIAYQPQNYDAWMNFVKMELTLGEHRRAVEIYEEVFFKTDKDNIEKLNVAFEAVLSRQLQIDLFETDPNDTETYGSNENDFNDSDSNEIGLHESNISSDGMDNENTKTTDMDTDTMPQ